MSLSQVPAFLKVVMSLTQTCTPRTSCKGCNYNYHFALLFGSVMNPWPCESDLKPKWGINPAGTLANVVTIVSRVVD